MEAWVKGNDGFIVTRTLCH